MSNKRKKQMNKESYDRCYSDYKYANGYDPMREIICDNTQDITDLYGTKYSRHDTNNYSKAVTREYKMPQHNKE